MLDHKPSSDRPWFLLWVLAGASLALTAYLTWERFIFDDRIPVFFDRVEALNSPITEGENLHVRIYRHKIRNDCPVTSSRRALDQDGRSFDIPNQRWAGGKSELNYLDHAYNTTELPAGDYVLFVDLDYECPGFVYSVDQPVVLFRITENNSQ